MPLLSLLTVRTFMHLLHLLQSARRQLLTNYLVKKETADNTTEDELAQYFTDKAARNCHALHWWEQNEFCFPNLAKVARSILCIPATSTPSERLFATAGLTVTKLRNCLNQIRWML